MKAIIFALAIICLGSSAAYAQKISEDKVPAMVVTNFKKQFAKASKPQWEMEEADFEVNFKNKYVVSFVVAISRYIDRGNRRGRLVYCPAVGIWCRVHVSRRVHGSCAKRMRSRG